MATLYPSQWAPGLWPGNGRTDNKVKGGKLQRRGTTGRLPQENETCHVYIRLLFSMCHIDWRWLVYWICCSCILEHMYTYDSHININIYINHKHMPNQKLLAEYCIPNLLANVQPIHHAWPNKIQTMDCLLLKKKYWVNLRISMTTISQNHPKNLWTSMDQNHGHMPILYKMVCKKVQLYKVAWSRHFWQPHPLYKLAGPCPSSIKLFARTSKKYFRK